ncbi:MAG: 50S ribosomal protein L23 [Candidatus Omnitrophica bacterium]|nr:50S ribosomal protein L23 [Candidatus Omnitrophota bacterium]
MSQAADVIRTLLRTEKGTRGQAQRQYLFKVDPRSNKHQIKQAVQELFKVKVSSVNTIQMMGKPRRMGRSWGHRPNWKKAMVTLAEGSKIEVAS